MSADASAKKTRHRRTDDGWEETGDELGRCGTLGSLGLFDGFLHLRGGSGSGHDVQWDADYEASGPGEHDVFDAKRVGIDPAPDEGVERTDDAEDAMEGAFGPKTMSVRVTLSVICGIQLGSRPSYRVAPASER